MRFWILFFILFGSLTSWAEPSFVDSPQHCFEKRKYPCRLRVTGGFLSFEKGANRFHLAEGGALLFESDFEIQLMQGQLWVLQSKDLLIKGHAAFKMQVSGEWFFARGAEGQLLARNLEGEVEFRSKYVFPSESLPPGFENWYGKMDSSGQVSRGVIRPISLVDFLKSWIPLSGLSIAEIRKASSEYKEKWAGAVEKSAGLYQEVLQRRLASHEEKKRQGEERKRQSEMERRRLQQMYREKNGLSGL